MASVIGSIVAADANIIFGTSVDESYGHTAPTICTATTVPLHYYTSKALYYYITVPNPKLLTPSPSDEIAHTAPHYKTTLLINGYTTIRLCNYTIIRLYNCPYLLTPPRSDEIAVTVVATSFEVPPSNDYVRRGSITVWLYNMIMGI